ncbi:MAG TPA: TonB-dependent receptor, partial [Bacteroidia bacterium]|nr:TonB-dependent receptor [Bacteroidia bacterium]
QLLNSANNPQVLENTWRVYAKVTQKFGSSTPMNKDAKEKTAANITNAYYTIQAGYGSYHKIVQDPVHQDNLFDYGYYGTFHQEKARTMPTDTSHIYYNGTKYVGYVQQGFHDSILKFTPSSLNPLDANYTSSVYNYVGAQNITTGATIQQDQGLLNGDHPPYIYSLWYGTGGNRGSYEYNVVDQTQITMKANFSADVFKNHAVQVGFEYDQRAQSEYAIGATSLWTLMRQLANYHLSQMDLAHPIIVPGGTYDYIYYDRKYDPTTQTQFDKSLRASLGMAVNSTNWIDIDSYQPSQFSLKMFSADDLLNNGGYPYIHYFGYDYTGAKLTGNPSFSDFFTAKDDNGNFLRNIPAFRPIYMAGYIQDKFDFRDIKFNIGLRIDRYDANQLMLKDKYLLFDARTAGEVNANTFPGYTKPSNIGSDYVVYVNAVNSPTAVVGYRNGDNWYDQNGTVVQDPSLLAKATQTGNITPWLVNPNQTAVTSSAFTSYVPQVNFMPRIAFAFPISEQANFFAHYDVLTQRPTQSGINTDDPINRLNPVDYLYIQSVQGNILNNPALKPERTTDYELGFTQVLNEKKNSALTLSAFYREMRDMIQIVKVNDAYPVSYLSWDNIDFGTVKGFTASYDLRRTNGVSLNASYTLQFADGTGSGVADGYNLVNSNQPNLRTTIPLNFDQRHSIVVNVDYRFGSGGNYHGPVYTKKKDGKTLKILNNVGANLTARLGSGTPYSSQSNATPEAQTALGVASRATLAGNVDGARLPWSYRMDLRIDKNIDLTWGGKKEGSAKKAAGLNVYIQVLNLLNTQNILHVYRYTGNPNDDGYINDGAAQSVIAAQASQQSFRDLYSVKVNNPSNYTLPRRIRLGVTLNF